MSRIGQYWTGLLKAGAVALVLALFGLSAAAAHDGAPHPAGMTSPAVAAAQPDGDCHADSGHGTPVDAPDHQHGKGTDGGCQDGCACGCISACTAHAPAGLPSGSSPLLRVADALCLTPSHGDSPPGRHLPPDLRPPLSV